jgi:hypothetical protein
MTPIIVPIWEALLRVLDLSEEDEERVDDVEEYLATVLADVVWNVGDVSSVDVWGMLDQRRWMRAERIVGASMNRRSNSLEMGAVEVVELDVIGLVKVGCAGFPLKVVGPLLEVGVGPMGVVVTGV